MVAGVGLLTLAEDTLRLARLVANNRSKKSAKRGLNSELWAGRIHLDMHGDPMPLP